jgi:hypothetical protein
MVMTAPIIEPIAKRIAMVMPSPMMKPSIGPACFSKYSLSRMALSPSDLSVSTVVAKPSNLLSDSSRATTDDTIEVRPNEVLTVSMSPHTSDS